MRCKPLISYKFVKRFNGVPVRHAGDEIEYGDGENLFRFKRTVNLFVEILPFKVYAVVFYKLVVAILINVIIEFGNQNGIFFLRRGKALDRKSVVYGKSVG